MDASLLVTSTLPAVALLVVVLFLLGVRRAAPEQLLSVATLTLGWVLLWGALAAAGVFADFDARPPRFALALFGILAGAGAIAFSSLGNRLARLPLSWLVGFHGFRLPLELVMHEAAAEGTMPVQMSFSGHNFDIVTGITALLVALVLRKNEHRTLALAWNLLGSVLLLAIVLIAVSSLPIFSAYGSDAQNRWVAYFPFIYLPLLCVLGALAGHLVLFRKLLGESSR